MAGFAPGLIPALGFAARLFDDRVPLLLYIKKRDPDNCCLGLVGVTPSAFTPKTSRDWKISYNCCVLTRGVSRRVYLLRRSRFEKTGSDVDPHNGADNIIGKVSVSIAASTAIIHITRKS